ncbi:MAG: hypothetical protein LJF04_08035 [Gemmatimonadetes bacterium]|nr:hypothetical protein [Gemmatimonadota bacterium]
MAAPSGPGRFLVAGSLAAVAGSERSGVDAVRIGSRLVAGVVRAGTGLGVNVVASPSLVRRELVYPGASVLETVLPLPALPGVALQWRSYSGAYATGGLEISLHLLPGQTDLRYRVGEAGVRVRPVSGDDDELVEVRVHPTPTSWSARESEGGGVAVVATVEGGDVVTALLAGGPSGRVEGAMGAASALGAHLIRAADPMGASVLALDTGAPALDRAWGWATTRVSTSVAWGSPGPETKSADLFWTGIGALAVGDGKTAAAALAGLDDATGTADPGLGAPAPTAALATFLAARLALTLGRTKASRARARSLGTLEEERTRCGPEEWAFWSLALDSLADALRFAASRDAVQTLRAVAASPPGRSGAVRLPIVGTPHVEHTAAARLRALLSGGGLPTMTAAAGRGVDVGSLGPWSALADGAVDEGYAAWRLRLDAGFTGTAIERSACRGTWDPTDDLLRAGAPEAGTLLATLAHGVLGLDPDAPSGRLRLAPAFPTGMTAFRARGMAVGDARVDLEYRRDGTTHRFVLTPREGRVPPMVVLEPWLPCAEVGAARVDGASAGLDATAVGDRSRVRVQLPLDGVRTLEVDCSQGG